MLVVAALLEQLDAALARLGGALATVHTDAIAAVGQSRRNDCAIEEFNRRLRFQQTLAPQQLGPRMVSDQQAFELTARAQVAAADLADAEQRAHRAWQQAQSDFDGVAYATPSMRKRMTSSTWDPAASVTLAATRKTLSCGPMDELALPTTGVLTGPDGRAYDLAVQTTRGADGRLLVSTQEQPADVAGWTRLAVRFGTTAYGRKASGWEKVAVALGGAAGAAYPEGSVFAPSLLGELHVMPGGGAYLPALPREAGATMKEASAEAPRGEGYRYWVAPRKGLASGRKASAPDGIGLVDAGIAGFLLARSLDDGRAADYRVVFEENASGERRARMQLYRVLASPGAVPRTVSEGGYVDSSGHLAGIPVTGEAPNRHPIITPAGS